MNSDAEVRIVVVDDHSIFRDGLTEILRSIPNFSVVAQGASSTDAITLAHDLKPDIMLLDVEIPGLGAEATVRRLLEMGGTIRVIMLTMHDDATLVYDLVRAGASGYLLKTAGRWELIAAINAMGRSDDAVVLSVSRSTILSLRAAPQTKISTLLSTREIEVMHKLAQGGSNKEIAGAMFISEATVKRHLANIYTKLGGHVSPRCGAKGSARWTDVSVRHTYLVNACESAKLAVSADHRQSPEQRCDASSNPRCTDEALDP